MGCSINGRAAVRRRLAFVLVAVTPFSGGSARKRGVKNVRGGERLVFAEDCRVLPTWASAHRRVPRVADTPLWAAEVVAVRHPPVPEVVLREAGVLHEVHGLRWLLLDRTEQPQLEDVG